MNLVIDSNRLRSDELRYFLAGAPSHRAVLTDYASMEAYKVNPLITIQKSMAVLAEFPAQVLVLRGTGRIARLDPRQSDFVEAMIWPEYTQMFPLHAASIPFIGLDDAHMVSNALMLHVRANELLALQSPEIFREFHEIFGAAYSKEALRDLRKGERSPDILWAMVDIAVTGAAHLLDAPDRYQTYDWLDVLNDFGVRNILARLLLTEKWLLDGRPKLTDERLLNDQVDSFFVTYGTYFNGLMSGDLGANRLYSELRALLLRFAQEPDRGLILPDPYKLRARRSGD